MSESEEETESVARPWVTWGLVVINAIIFLLMQGDGAGLFFPTDIDALRSWGAVDARLVWEGEGWRLFTGIFVHAAFWHVGMNMWVLLQVGGILERSMGAARYLLLYLVTGIAGFAASVLLQGGVTLGASGAIFGVVGGLFGLAIVTEQRLMRERLLSSLSLFVAATLAIGLAVPIIDNTAHIGGLLAGLLLSYGLLGDSKRSRLLRLKEAGVVDEETSARMWPRFSSLTLLITALLFALLLLGALRPIFSPRYHVITAVAALGEEKPELVLEHVQAAERLAPDDAAVLLLRARLLDGEDDERSRAFLRLGLDNLDPNPEAAHVKAALELGSPDGLHLEDGRLQIQLCEGSLRRLGEGLAPSLWNNCAWLLLTADDRRVRDPLRALPWAQRGVAQAQRQGLGAETRATFLHTLAEARAQNGEPGEAERIMKRVLAEEMTNSPFYQDELERFARLAREQAERVRAP